MSDEPLRARVDALRDALEAPPDPALVADALERVVPLRARLDVVYRDALERERTWQRTGGLSGAGRGGVGKLADDERPRCEWCRVPIANPNGDCPSCGHRPDIRVGHRRFKHR